MHSCILDNELPSTRSCRAVLVATDQPLLGKARPDLSNLEPTALSAHGNRDGVGCMEPARVLFSLLVSPLVRSSC